MTKLLALTHAHLLNLREREEGQGLTEYVFLIVGVVAMVGALVAVLTGALTNVITTAINGL